MDGIASLSYRYNDVATQRVRRFNCIVYVSHRTYSTNTFSGVCMAYQDQMAYKSLSATRCHRQTYHGRDTCVHGPTITARYARNNTSSVDWFQSFTMKTIKSAIWILALTRNLFMIIIILWIIMARFYVFHFDL